MLNTFKYCALVPYFRTRGCFQSFSTHHLTKLMSTCQFARHKFTFCEDTSSNQRTEQGPCEKYNDQRPNQKQYGQLAGVSKYYTSVKNKSSSSCFYRTSGILGFSEEIFRPCASNMKYPARHCSSSAFSYTAFLLDSPPVVAMQYFMEGIHNVTHIPWWGIIFITTLLARALFTLPLSVYVAKLVAKIELLTPTISMYNEALLHNVMVRCRRAGMTKQQAHVQYLKELRVMINDLYISENIQRWKMYCIPLIQIPLFITMSLALRNLCGFVPTDTGCSSVMSLGMMNEGILWFSDLTVSDPFYILPVLLGLINLANLQIHVLVPRERTLLNRVTHFLFKTLAIATMVVATQLPAAMSFYWTVSASYGFAQNIFLKYPFVRRKLGIPKTPSESSTPLMDMNKIIQQRAERFLSIQRQGTKKGDQENKKEDS